tara:strand:+ start:61 stop:372 length:312 start_codon:yes stop_codon:yes gene_type:complete
MPFLRKSVGVSTHSKKHLYDLQDKSWQNSKPKGKFNGSDMFAMADIVLGKDSRLDNHQHLTDKVEVLKYQNAVLNREKELINNNFKSLYKSHTVVQAENIKLQ